MSDRTFAGTGPRLSLAVARRRYAGYKSFDSMVKDGSVRFMTIQATMQICGEPNDWPAWRCHLMLRGLAQRSPARVDLDDSERRSMETVARPALDVLRRRAETVGARLVPSGAHARPHEAGESLTLVP